MWYLIKGWGYVWFFLLGIRVRIHYEQKLQKDKNYIFIANHSSFLDTPLIFRCCPLAVFPLATEEFGRIPLFGFLYRQMSVLVNRKDLESRRKSVQRLEKLLKSGKNIWLFPEGGINDTGKPLKKFYDGAFRLSLSTNTPIQPVVFTGTAARWRPDSFWNFSPGKCDAFFLSEIAGDTSNFSDAKALKEFTHEKLASVVKSKANKHL